MSSLLSLRCGCPVDPTEPPCGCAADAYAADLDAVADDAHDVGHAAARTARADAGALDLRHATTAEARTATRAAFARALAAAVVAVLCDHADLDDYAEAAVEGVAFGWADALHSPAV